MRKTCLCAVVALAFLALALPASAGITKGPFLLKATTTGVQIRFEAGAAGTCEWGTTPGLGSSMAASYDSGTHMNACALGGLAAGTAYDYRVTADGAQESGSFTTAPDPGATFNFVVMGDNRTNYDAHQSVIDAILAHNPYGLPDLTFDTGDLVEFAASDSNWADFFTIEKPLLADTVFNPIMGNHDYEVLTYYDRWFPDSRNYWFKYGNAVFVVLDTELAYGSGSAGYNMVVQALQAAQADPAITFKFVFFHKPGVTTGEHAPDATIVDDYLDVFEQYNVDIVFNGHNHMYEHGLVNGVHYVVTGGGGAPLSTTHALRDWTVYWESVYHFCTVQVTGNSYQLTAYRTDGSTMDVTYGDASGGGHAGSTPPDLEPGGLCGFAGGGTSDGPVLAVLLAALAAVLIRRRRA